MRSTLATESTELRKRLREKPNAPKREKAMAEQRLKENAEMAAESGGVKVGDKVSWRGIDGIVEHFQSDAKGRFLVYRDKDGITHAIRPDDTRLKVKRSK